MHCRDQQAPKEILLLILLIVPKNILTNRPPSHNLSVTVSPPVTRGIFAATSHTSARTTLRDIPRVKVVPSALTQSTVTEDFSNNTFYTTKAFFASTSGGSTYKNSPHTQLLTGTSISFKKANISTHFSQSIQATNEFPMLETFDTGAVSSVEPTIIESTNSTKMEGNATFQTDFSFDLLRSFVYLIVYIHENSDRAFAVVFGTLAATLFLALLVVFYFVACPRKRHADQTEQAQEEERTNLMSPHIQNVVSPPVTGRDTANEGNIDNNGDNTGVPFSQRNRRKRRLAHSRMLRKFCSCCYSNAPWQRGDQIVTKNPNPQSTTPADDDIISIHSAEETPPFQGPLPCSARRDSVDSPPEGDNEQPRQNEDTTSEYEFVDSPTTPTVSRPERPTTLQTNFHNSPMTSRSDYRNFNDNIPTNSNKSYTMQQPLRGQSRFYSRGQSVREPPPFPRQGGYNSHHQTVPNMPPQWRLYHQQVGVNAPHSVSPISVQQVPLRSNRQNHYVSLQPSFDAVHLDEARRDSFYDNSLPRDSPLYAYYQLQRQAGPELPGTRNINQYFS